jgi:hypothetical protein
MWYHAPMLPRACGPCQRRGAHSGTSLTHQLSWSRRRRVRTIVVLARRATYVP